VEEIAGERGGPMAQVALAWILSRRGISAPIVGATKRQHLTDALAAERLVLSSDELKRLSELYVPHAIAGH
jgi:aryl-alcohol dehydrogenase-like predicted oxidoreductase